MTCSCAAADGNRYRLTYRTNPDANVLEWQDGGGVTAYRYQHHDTPQRIGVRLVSCRPDLREVR